jgi:protein-tyrosine phosphatase
MNTACSEILPNLFVGSEKNAIEADPFDLVVNCTPNVPFYGKTNIRIPIKDDPFDSVPLFQILRDGSALQTIHDALERGGRVLVHCQAGAQRSPAVVACYLVRFRGMTPQDAIDAIRAARPIAFFCGFVNLRRAIELVYEYSV